MLSILTQYGPSFVLIPLFIRGACEHDESLQREHESNHECHTVKRTKANDSSKYVAETAALMPDKAAWLYDQGKHCGYETNVAKATAMIAGIEAVKQSMQAFGGWVNTKDYDIERWW